MSKSPASSRSRWPFRVSMAPLGGFIADRTPTRRFAVRMFLVPAALVFLLGVDRHDLLAAAALHRRRLHALADGLAGRRGAGADRRPPLRLRLRADAAVGLGGVHLRQCRQRRAARLPADRGDLLVHLRRLRRSRRNDRLRPAEEPAGGARDRRRDAPGNPAGLEGPRPSRLASRRSSPAA